MIPDRLKEVRKDYGDTQDMLAKKLNVSKFTVQSWEQGKSEPGNEMLAAICRLYNVSADFLLGLKDNDPLFIQQRERELSPENLLLLRRFEDFLLSEQKRRKRGG